MDMNYFKLLAFLFAIVLAPVMAIENPVLNDIKPTVINGFDWSLPAKTNAENYSGFIGEQGSVKDNLLKNNFVIVRWDRANPQKNIFNFNHFDKKLKQLLPNKVLVRLEVNSACEAPQWALQQLRSSKDKSLIFWDDNYINTLSPFIKKFAERYSDSSQLVGLQIGIGDGEYSGSCNNFDNKNGWGEFWMTPDELSEAKTYFGLTPVIFEKQSKKIINLYADAFGENKFKLAYMNQGPLFTYGEGSEPYNKKLEMLTNYALDIGLGTRDGAIEQWMSYTDKIFGNKITSMPDGTCRLDFDEAYAKQVQGRFWGTENEFYGKEQYILDRHGPYQNQPYRFLVSSLRALQMRRNFMSISDKNMQEMDHPDFKTQDFMHYLTKVLGKRIDNTPDAFVLLGERYISAFRMQSHSQQVCVKNSGDKIRIRSFGRWLTDTSESQPAIKIKMPASEKYWDQNYYLPEGIDYEYFAREAKVFNFDLNDELVRKRCKPACNVEIKVTFKDTHRTKLKTIMDEGSSQSLQTQGDMQIKTATFSLKSKFHNKNPAFDFSLNSEKGKIPVIMLRVNFL
ncbi:MAG: hypothetical protein V3U71_01830 [Cocleimonas sp.]